MLTKLYIQNYAIIDEVEINFSNKLNIITGETGAGKSILMGALNLILGERADSSVLVNKNKKCFVEGTFVIENKKQVLNFLQEYELDSDNDLLLRREIAVNGKSRAFINDTPATLQQLKQLALLLVDLHQQFDTLELGEADFQREVIDALADNNSILINYKTQYWQWVQAKKDLQELIQQKNNFQKEVDYNQFLFDELNDLNLKENELENLDNELKILSNSEGIKNALSKVYFELKESEQPLVTNLKQLINQLQTVANYHQDVKNIIERLQSTQIELQDISNEIDSINNTIHYDEQRINLINERIAAGYKLLKKHNVSTTNNLLQIQNELGKKLEAVLQIDDTIQLKENELFELQQNLENVAEKINIARKKQVIPFANNVNTLLHKVGMPNAQLKVELGKTTLNEFGNNAIEFLFDANKNNKFESIKKVASGGELSRLMLCIKYLVAEKIDLPTLIFDEIDTGISGEAAKQVGIILQQLAINRQIICITHQPQIAGKANAHYFVYKEIKENAVKTNIKLLDEDERIIAVAKMLSGEKPSAAALASAKEMMN
ncbi:MAG: DNA repair protein RecN [Bacteroidetes bacterium]|nr:DNA repair protein RecN [Bacteroidota bacterium]MBS1639405.1 DNA repair protein RecN [Bacteroidota bacterium]